MSNALLSQCKVLDFSDRRGSACGTFLASLGAEVIQVESNAAAIDLEKTFSERRGKKSVTLNLESAEGPALFKQLVGHSDFLIESFAPNYLASKQLAYAELAKINPRLIHVSITPFGQSGPYSEFKGGELVASAMGGTLVTCGYLDDTPVLEALDACCFHACAAAGLGAMLAHRERGISGLGQHIDISIQEVAASRNTNNLLAYQFDRRTLPRAGDKVRFGVATVQVIWQLADGYCFHSLMTGKFGAPANAALSRWMSEEGFDNPMRDVDWDRYDRSALPAETRLQWEAAIAKFFKTKTKAQIKSEGHQRGIRATVANEPGDVIADEHLVARQFLQPLTLPSGDSILAPNYFVRLSNSDYRIPAAVPLVGEHNDEIFRGWLGLDQQALARYREAGAIL